MTGSDERTAAPGGRVRHKTALFGFSILLGCGPTMLPMAAQAQYSPAPWSYPYYDGYPPPLPPAKVFAERRMAARENEPRSVGSDASYGVLPLAEIRRRIALMGFHLIAIPRHKDRIYLAEAEDAHGLRHRLVFDAYQGNIIENTKFAALPRKALAKPLATAALTEVQKKDGHSTAASIERGPGTAKKQPTDTPQ
jgi:hypothetical protein